MARALKKDQEPAPPPSGHNKPPLSDEDAAALTTHYELKIREAQRKVDAIQIDLKSARDVVNGHFKRMTADLGFSRKEFEAEVIATANMSEAEYLAAERKRARLHRLAGKNPGEQLDLVDAIEDTVDDEIAAEAEGYRAGRRADDPSPPKHIAGIMQPAWMRGWHKGQEENGLRLARAAEVLKARDAPPATVGEQASGDFAEDNPEIDVDAAARKLKNDPAFMDRSAPADEEHQAAA
jgi:hypothetical protein